MTISNPDLYTERLLSFKPYRRAKTLDAINALTKSDAIVGILLGGSTSYKQEIEKSDVDLFCLFAEHLSPQKIVHETTSSLTDVAAIIYQGFFPWTGELYTIYYTSDIDFSIDLALVNVSIADSFFWEPEGIILWDPDQLIERHRATQLLMPGYTKQPFLKSNPFSLAVIALKKISKNLDRGHLWNAIEQLSIMRRYVMQIIRLNVVRDTNFLGRVDRDIEDSIPTQSMLTLSRTAASYDKTDIAMKTMELVRILESLILYLEEDKEGKVKAWLISQITHETGKLLRY